MKLSKKYKKARELYIVCRWYDYGILTAKYADIITETGDPLTIQYTDHNGLHEEYFIAPWYQETTGETVAYFFNKFEAEALIKRLKNNE